MGGGHAGFNKVWESKRHTFQEGGAALQAQAKQPDWTQDGRGQEQQNRFESSLEDFHSTIDQMELNLKCALETTGQSQSSQRYMPLPLLSYQQVTLLVTILLS